ncbi:MAG: PstS family phosphate ABC transporter substrate-binding protein [Phycisphaeraceae bacterium]|nr:PstS family phosphate ABC transporter substrate-binding protein [Phycisphaeraceae bacterium]MCB9847342.1 PstS family phosphate ABC transporter substrate-binding protein [Phycisphaeraceae bacterium]
MTAAAACLGIAASTLIAGSVKVDNELPYYKTASGVSGSLKSVGSDTMNNLMTLWFERFEKSYPNVSTEVEGKGSSTAPPALIEGIAQFGPMSRPIKDSEIDKFEKRYGYKPTQLRTAIDALAVFVHKDNPIKGLTLEQVEQIFSVNGADMTWGDVGLKGEWANKPISLYGRNSASGTYGFFKEVGLGGNDYKPTVKEQPGSSAVVQGVATDKYAMGYSGLGYATADVRAIPLAIDSHEPMFAPNAENANSGDYPLARFLYLTVNYKPGSKLEPLRAEFIKLIYTKEGQEIVVKDGYFPVSADLAREDLRRVGISPSF